MDINTINKHINKLCKYIANHRLSDVFKRFETLTKNNKSLLILKEQLERQEDIYKSLLRYSFTEVKDPERDKIYSKLLQSLFEITDKAKYLLFQEQSSFVLNKIHKDTEIAISANRNNLEQKFLNNTDDSTSQIIFNKYWLSGKLEQNDIDFIKKVIAKEDIDWVNEAILVSALTSSLLINFDIAKLHLLFDFYYKGTNRVWQRAIVGIVFGINQYSNRLNEYVDLKKEIKILSKDKDFMQNLQYVLIQVVKTKDTEKISKQLHEEIMPQVAKFKPKIEERLRLDDIIENLGEDENPDWEKVFGDSPELLSKLEEFSQMQIEGSDVFMGTFAMLKHFDFFKEPVNWFMPFYAKNPKIQDDWSFNIKGFDTESFFEGIENAAFLCNSDKYSFVLNIKEMPDVQKGMLLEMFQGELDSMNEIIKDDKILNKSALDKYQINQYVQDLYRFYKLFTYKNEFADIFETNSYIYNNSIILQEWFSPELYKNIGEILFKNEHYQDCIKTYKILIDNNINEQPAFEKIAYSYQKIYDFENALNYYKKAELFDKNLKWVTKKIALCYRELNQIDNAIEYYKKAEQNEPENLYVQANLGHNYLRNKDYENALKHYFKVEYFSPSNKLIQRPIAWCSFALGKFDVSINYYLKLIEQNQADWQDYINYGHALWCNGVVKNAIDAYKESIKLSDKKKNNFRNTFIADKAFLTKFGISEFDIELMMDYIYEN